MKTNQLKNIFICIIKNVYTIKSKVNIIKFVDLAFTVYTYRYINMKKVTANHKTQKKIMGDYGRL